MAAATQSPTGSRATQFTWDPSSGVPQVVTTSTGGVDIGHLYGMGRALALRGAQSDSYAHDARSSTLAVGEAADLARAADYDEFGLPTASGAPPDLFDEVAGSLSNADDTPTFGYRGEAHLDGMVHLRARDHAPGLGRFTTTDPLDGVAGETTVANPYPYAASDPVNLVDPLGLRPLSDAELAVKIGFAGALTAGDPWLASFVKRLFGLYNANHTEAVRLAAQQIVLKFTPSKLSVEAYVNGVYPDIVAEVKGQVYFWEVKPNTEYGRRTGLAQLSRYRLALAEAGGLPGPKIGAVTTPMSTTGGLYVHDAPTDGLIYYEKDQRKLLEEAREYADEHAQDPEPTTGLRRLVRQPLPFPVPWWWPE